MPDMDGLDVLQQVRDRDLHMPVIMVTASGSKERAVQAVSMGAQAYVLKPFDPLELQQVVEHWIGRTA
ncbi:MAG: response regulator [Nitrospirales bacterium]|nr:response regulator [Nitrospirales bacterium]